jgi:hypothetical protein
MMAYMDRRFSASAVALALALALEPAQGIQYLAYVGLVTPARAAAILIGAPP